MENIILESIALLSKAQLLSPLSRRQVRLLYQAVYPQESVPRIESEPEQWQGVFKDNALLVFLCALRAQLQTGSTILFHRPEQKLSQSAAYLFRTAANILDIAEPSLDYETLLSDFSRSPLPYPEWLIGPQPSIVESTTHPVIIQRPEGFSFQKPYFAEQRIRAELKKRLRHANISPDPIFNAIRDCLSTPGTPQLHPRQVAALFLACRNLTTIVSGGPGTGKTTVGAQIIRTLQILDPSLKDSEIALTAPTGRAAARLKESLYAIWGNKKPAFGGGTLHGLLRYNAATGKFTHHADNPLPYRVVIADETSMIDIYLFAHFLSALSPDCRLILLGDRDQLPSVDAGAVLGDLTNTAYGDMQMGTLSRETYQSLAQLCTTMGIPEDHSLQNPNQTQILRDHLVILTHSHRYGEDLGLIAKAILSGQSENASRAIEHSQCAQFLRGNLEEHLHFWFTHYVQILREPAQHNFTRCSANEIILPDHPAYEAADRMMRSLQDARILCPMKQDIRGTEPINAMIHGFFECDGELIAGTPIMISRNTSPLQLFNGDHGILVQTAQGLSLLTGSPAQYRLISQFSLPQHQVAYAITIHKSQGSEYNHVFLILPEQDNIILTRELLYTAVTRARKSVRVYGWDPILCSRWLQRTIHRESGLLD